MKLPQEKIKLTAFHGTSALNAQSIMYNNFTIQPSAEDWLGHGVYFFVEGISCPHQSALEWAHNTHLNLPAAVIKSTIIVDANKVLDLRKDENLRIYNEHRTDKIEKYYHELRLRRDLTIKKRRDTRVDDQIITNLITVKLSISVLIYNAYIKNSNQRELALESNYPNTTVCCVNDVRLIAKNEYSR